MPQNRGVVGGEPDSTQQTMGSRAKNFSRHQLTHLHDLELNLLPCFLLKWPNRIPILAHKDLWIPLTVIVFPSLALHEPTNTPLNLTRASLLCDLDRLYWECPLNLVFIYSGFTIRQGPIHTHSISLVNKYLLNTHSVMHSVIPTYNLRAVIAKCPSPVSQISSYHVDFLLWALLTRLNS